MRVRKKLSIEWMVPLLTFLLLIVGSAAMFSASSATHEPFFAKQLFYLGLGVVLFLIASFLPDRFVFAFVFIAYTIGILLLALVMLVGSGPTNRWLAIGSFHLQPSELAKMTTLLALARFLTDRRIDLSKPKILASYIILSGLPFGLVLVEPDLGTSLIFPVLAGFLAFWGGIPALTLVLLLSLPLVMIASVNPYILVAVIGGLILYGYFSGLRMALATVWGICAGILGFLTPKLWMHLKPYQRQRLLTFINPDSDPLGSGYQLIQSKIAIGSGKFWGKGFLHGTQTHGGFLPEQHTDFIFSLISEEFGFIGATLVIILFWLLILRLLYLARKVEFPFSSLFIVGVAAIIGFQTIVNLGMTMGIMPVAGLPLPLISYGGSSMLTTLMMLGLATGMGSRWRSHG